MNDSLHDSLGVCRKLSAGTCSPCFCPTKCDHRKQGVACNCEPICALAGQIPPPDDGGHWEGDFYVSPGDVWWNVKSKYFPRTHWAMPAAGAAPDTWWRRKVMVSPLQIIAVSGLISLALDLIKLVVRHIP